MASAPVPDDRLDGVQLIDVRQPRLGQAITAAVAAGAYVFRAPVLLPVMAVVMGFASLGGPKTNVYVWLFKAIRPRLGPTTMREEPWPPRFANLCGFVFFGAATVAFYFLDAPVVAWGLDLVVASLALLSATTGLCLGCELFVIGRRIATRGRVATKTVVAGVPASQVSAKSKT